jgi:hypothetical protein
LKKFLLIASLATSLLVGCGGGGGSGGSSGPIASTLTFPVKSADAALTASGYTKNWTISGTCSGTAIDTTGAAAGSATFNNTSGLLSATNVTTMNFTNCVPSPSTSTATQYWDTNYVPVGINVSGGTYSVFLAPPTVPATATVGATGVIGTITRYTDSTTAVLAGHADFSYVVEADTANTAIVNIIMKDYNAVGTLTSTQQSRYRVATTGPLVPVSIDVQLSNGSTTHLVFQ